MLRFTRFTFNRHGPHESVVHSRPRFDRVPMNHYSRRHRFLEKKHHWKHGSGLNAYFPGQQMTRAQEQHVQRIADKMRITESESYLRNYSQTQMMRSVDSRFGESADDSWIKKGTLDAMKKGHELKQLQGLGDDQPLATDPDLGISPLDIAAHGRKGAFERIEPPVPYTKRLSRRMAEGKLWPTIHGTEDQALKEPNELKHPENMSPSEQKFAAEVEYWLRRNLRAMPAHIGDQVDFAEFVVERCYVSRRCKELTIVWSTVSGAARLKIEPVLLHLNPWVIRTIKRRIKNVPNIPRVSWVYDSGAIPTQIPNKLKHQLKVVLTNHSATIEQRVDYLKQLDSMEHRIKGIPWFMPYLWSKEQKVTQSNQMRRDFVAMKEQQKHKENGSGDGSYNNSPGYVA